jgi:hypothetical protein
LTLSFWSAECRQIRNWGHTPEKAKEIQALTAAWADFILKKRGAANKLPDFAYLTEAEPFLAAYMQKGEAARRLVGNADVSTVGVTYGHLPAGLKDELEDHKDEVVQGKAPAEAGEAGQAPEGDRAYKHSIRKERGRLWRCDHCQWGALVEVPSERRLLRHPVNYSEVP